jgi:tRNA(fMet)-specific endonuclease VapC
VTALRHLLPERISVSWVTVGEIYEVAFDSVNPEAHLVSFRRFLAPIRIVNLNEGIIERFAETRSFLRRRGQLISDFDLLLAATALHHDLTVLTFNRRHFERIPDLKLYQPR